MVCIRCTQKLLKLLGVKPTGTEASEDTRVLGDWYANLIWIERKKCILFTNEPTLFSFLVANVRKEEISDLGPMFRASLKEALRAIQVPAPLADRFLLRLGEIRVGGTQSKSVLGSMKDYAEQYKCHVLSERGLGNCDLADITRRVNDSPMRAIGYQSGAILMRQYLKGYTISL